MAEDCLPAGPPLAVVVATQERDGRPLALIRLCGVPLLQRTLLALRSVGLGEAIVLAGEHGDLLEQAVGKAIASGLQVTVLSEEARDWPGRISGQRLLVLEGHYVWDARTLAALCEAEPPSVLVDREHQEVYAGAVSCTADAWLARFGEEWGPGWLRLARAGTVRTVDVAALAAHQPDLRRTVKPYWFCIRSEADAQRAKAALIGRAQKGTLDWWAWFVNRPVENWLLRIVADWPFTPNQVSLLTNLAAYAVAALWASGHLWPWALLALVVSVLDGLDGKLARVKGLTTRLGTLEHSFDVLWEQTWYAALAWAAYASDRRVAALLVGLGLLLLDTFNRHLSMQFRQTTGRSLAEYSAFDRRFRWIDGRRNTYLPYILIGAALGRPLWSLAAMVVHAALTAVVYCVQAGRHLRALDKGRSA